MLGVRKLSVYFPAVLLAAWSILDKFPGRAKTKSSERSSLVSGPGLNSSPLEAKNPSVFLFSNNLSLSREGRTQRATSWA